VKSPQRLWMIHTTDPVVIGSQVGLFFYPEDIHVMSKLGAY
jgi:hypothetical protein